MLGPDSGGKELSYRCVDLRGRVLKEREEYIQGLDLITVRLKFLEGEKMLIRTSNKKSNAILASFLTSSGCSRNPRPHCEGPTVSAIATEIARKAREKAARSAVDSLGLNLDIAYRKAWCAFACKRLLRASADPVYGMRFGCATWQYGDVVP